jgi:hypothetical protein
VINEPARAERSECMKKTDTIVAKNVRLVSEEDQKEAASSMINRIPPIGELKAAATPGGDKKQGEGEDRK